MPYKVTGHRIATDLMHPWVLGYRRHPFMRDFWRYVDIDTHCADAQADEHDCGQLASMRGVCAASLAAIACVAAATLNAADAPNAPKRPRCCASRFRSPRPGFDPAQISDLYSRTITAHIFEGLYAYDHLARPAKIKPLTAAAMPEVSSDFRTWTVKLRPGIYFADDPAFKGASAK